MTFSFGGLRPPKTRLRRCPRIALLAVLVTGLALPAPSAFAHGNQFLCACVTIGDDGRVALELMADHADNPNIANAEAAQQVLRECLQVCIGEERHALTDLGVLRFSTSTTYRDDSPVPTARDPGPHQLVVAHWEAYLPGKTVVFAAKERTPLDLVMWRGDQAPEPGRSRWTLLIAGDRSPAFAVATATVPNTWWLLALGGIVLIGLVPWWRRRRIRACRSDSR